MQSYNHKIFAFVIALKRYRRNSIIQGKAAYKLANIFGMSAATFKKYLQSAIEQGYIKETKTGYEIIRFENIVRDFYQKTNLYFGSHRILRSGSIVFKDILNELHGLFVKDNIIARQQSAIKKKEIDIRLLNFASRTVKRDSFLSKSESKRLKKLSREGKICAENANKLSESYKSAVITSSRHTAKTLGVSVKKANQILNSGSGCFQRDILVKWVKGISFFKLESLRIQYPNATIIPLLHYNAIKICFGSSLSCP